MQNLHNLSKNPKNPLIMIIYANYGDNLYELWQKGILMCKIIINGDNDSSQTCFTLSMERTHTKLST